MPIKNGDTVSVHYTGRLEDGSVFDSSRQRNPLDFKVGAQMVIEGFDAAVLGREVGDSVTVAIPPEKGYGDRDDALIFTVERAQVPDHIQPEVGLQLHLTSEQGQMDVVVVEVNDDAIVLDANHPLAGKTLTFDIEIMNVA